MMWPRWLLQRKIIFFGGLFTVAIFTMIASWWFNRVEVVAQLAQFYPSTCLGGWQQPQLATGIPDAAGDFTKDNSALYTDNATAIYCGQFTGSLPPQTYHTRVTVRFSWYQEGGETGGSTVEEFESFAEPVIATTTDVLIEEQATSTQGESPAEVSQEDTQTDSSVPEEIPVVETPPTEVIESEAEPIIEEEPVAEPSADSSEPISWWLPTLVSMAHAQAELLSPVVTTNTLDEALAGATFMIQYTLDGAAWQTIGYVSDITPDIRFEIPREVITTMADVSALQVAVVPLPFIDAIQPVYLDSVWLEIGYAPLEELGVHSLPVEQPRVVPFSEVIGAKIEASTTTATTSSSDSIGTSTALLSVSEFARKITKLHGIDGRYVLVSVELVPAQTELWLFDMLHREVHLIGTKGAMIGSVPAAVKDKMIFWIGQDLLTVFAYDLRTAGTFHQMSLVGNLPVQDEYRLTFPFTAWEVIWRGSELYFFSKETGEVFGDGESEGVADFLAYFSIAAYMSPDRLRTIGGPFVSIPDVPVILSE